MYHSGSYHWFKEFRHFLRDDKVHCKSCFERTKTRGHTEGHNANCKNSLNITATNHPSSCIKTVPSHFQITSAFVDTSSTYTQWSLVRVNQAFFNNSIWREAEAIEIEFFASGFFPWVIGRLGLPHDFFWKISGKHKFFQFSSNKYNFSI